MGNNSSRTANNRRWTLFSSCNRHQEHSDQNTLIELVDKPVSRTEENNVLVEIISGDRRKFAEGLIFIIDEVTQEAPPLADHKNNWPRLSIMQMRSTMEPELKAYLDSKLVTTLICQLEEYCSPEEDINVMINALTVIHMVVNLCLVFQRSYGSIFEPRFTEEHLIWLGRLWFSHDNRDVIKWLDEIIWKLWHLPLYNGMLINIFSTHFKQMEWHTVRYVILSHKGQYLCDEISPIPNILEALPQITINLYRALIVALNCWRLCENRPHASEWCAEKCENNLELVRQFAAIKFDPARIGRVLRSAACVIIQRPEPRPEFYPEFKKLLNFLRNRENMPGVTTVPLLYYLMSIEELRASIAKPGEPCPSLGLDTYMKVAMIEKQTLDPLSVSDLNMFSPPVYVTAYLRRFSRKELCFDAHAGSTLDSTQRLVREILDLDLEDSLNER